MKFTDTTVLKSRQGRADAWATSVVVALLVALGGCSKAPEAPTPAQQQQSFDAQIQSIQNNPNMPPAAKQQAINGIKAQQSRTATQR